ncbi:MAG: FHA domain-containing protein [Verrucomicrobiota bacterium]
MSEFIIQTEDANSKENTTLANQTLISYLETFGPQLRTGVFRVMDKYSEETGAIFMHDGLIVYAETEAYTNRLAILLMMVWKGATVEFLPQEAPPKVGCSFGVDLILFQFIQLEDQYPHAEALKEYLDNENARMEMDVYRELPDLKLYSIYLEAEREPHMPIIYELREGDLTLGGSEKCDIVVQHPAVSRIHCKIKLTQSSMVIQDLGSTNGTFVEGSMVEKSYIVPGDLIQLGEHSLRIKAVMKRNLTRQHVLIEDSKMQEAENGQDLEDSFNPVSDTTKVIHWKNFENKKSPRMNLLANLLKV